MGDLAQVEEEVLLLIDSIRRLSGGGSEVTFGALSQDDLVANTFEALFGTLKAARKRGIVDFEGELLLMGKHDDTVIRLAADAAPASAAIAAEEPNPVAEEPMPPVAFATDVEPVAEPLDTPVQAPAQADMAMPAAVSPVSPVAEANAESDPIGEADNERKEDGKKWNVDTSYIDRRTADPDRLEARRSATDDAAEKEAQIAAASAAATKEKDGSWKQVDVGYINHRTADPNRLEARRSVGDDAETKEAEIAAAAAAANKDTDGSWKTVNVGYINHRTADPNRLEARRNTAEGAEDREATLAAATANATRAEDGSWKQVDVGYINHRTTQVENLEGRKANAASADSHVASATVKKEGDGKWKVDTSYIGYRTGDTNNLIKNQSVATESSKFLDPSESKFPYEALKGSNRPPGVDPTRKELYLTDDEFEVIFGMPPADFARQAKWKQQNAKKAKDVF